MQRVLADRLSVSEAIEAVGRMLRGFNQPKEKSYIGAMAEYLTRYPRVVALECADPFGGVVAGTKYLPTPADVIGFCERKLRPLQEDADRERRVAEQLVAREEFERQRVADQLKAKGRAWLDRTDPAAQQLSGQKAKGQLTQEELDSIIADAQAAGAGLAGMRLSAEALALIGSAKRIAAMMDEEVT